MEFHEPIDVTVELVESCPHLFTHLSQSRLYLLVAELDFRP